MKALSVQQPWAWLFNGKPVENRDRNISHRGPLIIHASKTFDHDGLAWIILNCKKLGIFLPDMPQQVEDYPMGSLIGIVSLFDVVKKHDSPWFLGSYGYLFKNQVGLAKPVEFRGMPGLFNVPEEKLFNTLIHLQGCPNCRSNMIHANIGHGLVDSYCEECGWPDEERG